MVPGHITETYKSLVAISIELLKILALINGGAAIATLSYFGANRANVIDPAGMKLALMVYASGVLFVPLAFLMAYFTQFALFNEEKGVWQQKGYHMIWVALGTAFVVASVVCFFAATWIAAFAT